MFDINRRSYIKTFLIVSTNPQPGYNKGYMEKFEDFLKSRDTLRVYCGDTPVFSSSKERLLPLVECIKNIRIDRPAILFDRVTGNAASLLAVKLGCNELYSPLGSQLAIKTLLKYGITFHFLKIVTYIQNETKQEMCPMEKLSINKGPEEFYNVICSRLNNQWD